MSSYDNGVKRLAHSVQSMNFSVNEEEIAMVDFHGLPTRYGNLIVAWEALGNVDRLFILEYVKSRLLQEKSILKCKVITLHKLEVVISLHCALVMRSLVGS